MTKEERKKQAEKIREIAKLLKVDTRNLIKTVLRQSFEKIEKLYFQGWIIESFEFFNMFDDELKSMFLLDYCQKEERRIEIFFSFVEKMEMK